MKPFVIIAVIVVVLVGLNYFGFFIPLNKKGLPGVGKCKNEQGVEGNYAFVGGKVQCAT